MYTVISVGSRVNSKSVSQMHSHNFWEFVYYLDGYGTVTSGFEDFAFAPYTFVAHPPHTLHCEYAQGTISNIYVLADIGDALPFKRYDYKDPDMHEMHILFLQLRYQFTRRSRNWKEINHALLSLMIQYLLAKPTSDTTNECINTAASIIINGLSDKSFNLNMVYDNIPMSKTYFAMVFKNAVGFTPLEYLMEKRIETAKDLMKNEHPNTVSISSIAERCGFQSIYYFSRVFKKKVGVSPLQWCRDEYQKQTKE
ncbi:MAG: helix-turn-helix transcriptional regulator [Clostridia bacterium]|nr:helix-turn-helix transcriptional regulator [Clostridia bacterium]